MVISDDKMTEYREARHIARVLGADKDAVAELEQPIAHDQASRERMRNTYHGLAAMEGLANDADIQRILEQARSGGARHSRRIGKTWAIAAVIVLGIGLLFGVMQLRHDPAGFDKIDRYVTRVGEQREVTLPDGSQMMLNTGTEVLVNYDASVRKLVMSRGEAFFAVTADPARPFTIEIGTRAVTVLGTAFNVMKNRSGFDLSVEKGVVAVHPSGDTVETGAAKVEEKGMDLLGSNGQRRVEAGWSVSFNSETKQLLADEIIDVAAWRTGMLNFINEPLVDVISEVNRYSAKKILIEDSEIVNKRISASIRIDRINAALRVIGEAHDMRIEENFDNVSIKGKSF